MNGLIEWLIDVVRKIEKRSGGPRKESLLIHGIGVPGGPQSGRERGAGVGFQVSIA